ncbi:peptidase inhibitor family I36 protein [Streptomyces clavifer]|uniref:peptidase inhibitor family I36 protein n=1 Tax=Streptomyces clavifer TaxID=68188 RepID=UPI00352D3306
MATSTVAQAASTDGSCPSGNLCLWENTNFTGARLITASTNACIRVGIAHQSKQSYISHLPVTAVLWIGSYSWEVEPVRTLPSGGFSSAFPAAYYDFICTNGKIPLS